MAFFVLHTYGILEHPNDHPASQAFWAAVPDVQVGRENADGLLRGATIPFNIDGTPFRETTEFGVPVTPHFHDASQERTALATLSAWIDPESAAGYSFHGAHGGALKYRSEWFRQEHSWPSSVMWWTDDIESINWEVANAKIAQLDEHGPSPDAFSFKSMYTNSGEKIRMDNERMKDIGGRAR